LMDFHWTGKGREERKRKKWVKTYLGGGIKEGLPKLWPPKKKGKKKKGGLKVAHQIRKGKEGIYISQ